jgi:hydroxypyruvate isomerase
MARFAPNLYHLFLELPACERFAEVKRLGFDAVEWHFPYEIPKLELRDLLQSNGLKLVNAVTPVDWRKDKGLAAQPGREDEFRRSAEIALDYAQTCGWLTLHPGAGTLPSGYDREACVDVLARNLDWIAAEAASFGLVIAIEGVCNARFPNCVLQTLDDAVEVVTRVNRPNLKVVFDTYHLRMEHRGPLTDLLERHWPLIGHVQIGTVPLRHEPGVGELDLHFLIDQIDRLGWPGWIGLEFDPSLDSWRSLLWANRYGYRVEPSPLAARGKLANRIV